MLMVWCAFSVAYGLFAWGHYIIIGARDDSRLALRQAGEFQDYQSQHPRYGAAALQVQDVRATASVPGRYDFLALVGNPNARWIAFIEYQFTYNDGTTEKGETVVLPGIQRPVMVFGQKASQFPVGVTFEITDTQWWHVDPHVIPDIDTYTKERVIFDVDNVQITSAGFDTSLSVHRIEFDITNNSAYSYAEAPFYVVLRSGGGMAAVIPHTFDSLRAGETVHVDLRSGIESLNATDVEVIPLMNIFSSRSFLDPEG